MGAVYALTRAPAFRRGVVTLPKKIGTIEIDQDLDFQRRSWRVQRASWLLMVFIVIAALLGVFGGGFLSKTTAGETATLAVEYDRFIRSSSPARIAVTIGAAAAASQSLDLWLDRRWLSGNKVNSIVPEPDSTTIAPDRVTYHFSAHSGRVPSTVEFDLETRVFGSIRGRAGVVGGKEVSFTQFSYP